MGGILSRKKWCPGQVVALYQKECGSWMMEIRWFDRYEEILPQHKSGIEHLNRPHVLFETEVYDHLPVSDALPGRVILTSVEQKESWKGIIRDTTGLPIIPRLCTRICFDEEIETSMDWTNYDLNLPQIPPGLSRGLILRPKNRQGKEWVSILSRLYIRAIKMRGVDPNHHYFQKWSKDRKPIMQGKPMGLPFKPEESGVELGQHLLTINLERGSQDFYRSVFISSPATYLVSPTMEIKRMKNNSFKSMPGDIVCFFDKNASIPENYTSAQRIQFPWHPFRIPFSYGQILSIYKESIVDGGDSIKIEIRRFYKSSELSNDAKEFLPLQLEGNHDEIFESNDIEVGIYASSLLGTADVLLGNHMSSGSENERKHITCCRCKYFYLKAFQRLQPIYWSGMSPAGWDQGLRQRGYKRSIFLQKYDELKDALANGKNILPNIGQICDVFAPVEKSPKEGSCVGLRKQTVPLTSHLSFYEEASLNPQWSIFHASDYLSLADCSDRKLWILKIGDVVAVRDPEAPQSGTSLYPFLVHWFPGQILAIYNESNKNEPKHARFEIRCLKFEASTKGANKNQRRKITDCNPPKTLTATSTDLLGPLTLYYPGAVCETDLTKESIHLPLSEFLATQSLKVDIESVLAFSKVYSSVSKTSARNPIVSNLERDLDEHQYSNKPFRFDVLHLRSFYTEMTFVPKFKIFFGGNRYQPNSVPNTIKIGDTIRVRFEGSKRYPYDCNWSVAEVVAIFKEFPSQDEFNREQNLNPDEHCHNKFQIEIRWFYERRDISTTASSVDDASGFIEVYETDHCQVMDASNAVLDHVKLVEDGMSVKRSDGNYFLCTRFWSTKRRSLIPCSGLSGRIKRGLIHSTLGLEQDLDTSPTCRNDSIDLKINLTDWKDSMANLICKLTLKDASKNAYESGEALVGREKELSQLLTFFRAAFLEDHRSEGYKSSMFLAGPPGVGKTATVRAAIARLQQEQKAGEIPKFKFIPLNGIEVRHPPDIYIRFWETLTGKNHVGPHERACERLEEFFTSKISESDLPNTSTTIVLLDEIDYLVTDDQSVLYNLFDWPKRAAEVASTSRLIVVGISNTLNLVDHLIPSVQSRVGTEKCVFKAYSLNDTTSILRSKMKEGSPNFNFFEDDAILFAAKKTAALSGDIRKAFQICRSAAELVTRRFEEKRAMNGSEPEVHPKIRISDVQKASLESFNMAMVTAVSFSSSFEVLLLVSLAALCRSTGRDIGGFNIKDILAKMEALANASGNPEYIPAPSFGETIRVLTRLGEVSFETKYEASGANLFVVWFD
uniref:BAH domain-containing protein n=1 Tax=Pseudo-nitzschia australis TaxID=44445 RepID=A0A7S4AC08_9STRA